ncbi:MAG TPA: 3-deoxy-manno-octulosonate cytidylyltransferase [Candidatus Deferrimicrobium sp.]|nr:3-deoxy-manno-octulosonate cytidylyltransferase [Candidatus Deferrimicrobium sp.]
MKAPRVLAVIPARLNSRRFPHKIVYPYRGRPLVLYVYNEICKARRIDRVVIATDSREVADVVTAYGADVVRTSPRHSTGSDRVAEAARKLGGDIIINVQADCFGLPASSLDRIVASLLKERKIGYATVARPIDSESELQNPNLVKVVAARDGRALWFSRSPIPFQRDASGASTCGNFSYLAHIGVYFFRRAALARFAAWRMSPLEKAESLEQLRILEHGGVIRLFKTLARSVSVDSPEDVKKLDALYGGET